MEGPTGERPRIRPRWLALWALAGLAAAAVIWWSDPRTWGIPMCTFHRVTGLHCPGCGATRATHELLHGRLLSAMHYNALYVLALPLIVYQGLSWASYQCLGRSFPGDVFQRRWFLPVLLTVVIVFGIGRNLPWYPWTLLAPP